jgi:hypothetical protein
MKRRLFAVAGWIIELKHRLGLYGLGRSNFVALMRRYRWAGSLQLRPWGGMLSGRGNKFIEFAWEAVNFARNEISKGMAQERDAKWRLFDGFKSNFIAKD